jgi:hypothetical protein
VPGIFEQARETGFRAGLFRAGNRVARNDLHRAIVRRDQRLGGLFLDRTDIGEDRAGLHVRHRGLGNRRQRADRHAEDHAVGFLHGICQRFGHISEIERLRPGPDIVAGIIQRDRPRRAIGRSGPRDG